MVLGPEAADLAPLGLIQFEVRSGRHEDQSMKRSREQIIRILKEHESGVSVADLCRKHGVSDASIYKWKPKFGRMEVSDAKRLKTLEDENTRLKRCDAGQSCLEGPPGKEVVTAAGRRKGVAHLVDAYGMAPHQLQNESGNLANELARRKLALGIQALRREGRARYPFNPILIGAAA
jgi:putative transposase